ncbi:hypothetical protein Tco_0604208 [Tanacetum coccineum]
MVKIHTDKNVADLLTKSFNVKTINGEAQLHALVDGKKIIIIDSSIRRDLQLVDEEGVDCLPNSTIFEQLTLMGPKTTTWNEFSSTMASAIICLATNQKFNFSKFIFDSMIRNLDNLSDISKAVVPRVPRKPWGILFSNRFENVSKHSNESLLVRGNTLQSDEDRLKLDELMALFGLTTRVESSDNEESLGKDASKQGRIDVIDADEEITLVSVQNVDEEMFDVNVLDGEEVFVQNKKLLLKV